MSKDIIINKRDNIYKLTTDLSTWGDIGPSAFANAIAKLKIDSNVLALINEIFSETAARERYFLYNFFSRIWDGNGCVVEVGAFFGGTTRSIALGMKENLGSQKGRFLTVDRFEGYHKMTLEQEAKELLIKYANDERIISDIRRGNWLSLFKAVHKNQIYGDILEIVKAKLPDKSNEPFPEEMLTCFDSIDYISVLFVDGCKSWYSTKALMKVAIPKIKIGGFIIFQDYGRHTCFWISSFCEEFKKNFKLIGSISGTYAFKYVEGLKPDDLEKIYPSSPDEWSRDKFRGLYQNALDEAFLRSDSNAMVFLTLQMAAAYAYLGFKDEARNLIAICIAHPSMRLNMKNSMSALKTPTFTPDNPIYLSG